MGRDIDTIESRTFRFCIRSGSFWKEQGFQLRAIKLLLPDSKTSRGDDAAGIVSSA